MQLEIPQQLNCPICMSIFKIPITTECGHSFCRSCLINSAKTKKVCPICRQEFQSSPEKLKQDDMLSHILEDFLVKSVSVKKKEDTSFQGKGESMLLIDIKTEELLLPYNKVLVSFQLQNPSLLNKRDRFVARQEAPFDKFGVISRIVSLNKLRYNVYECILEGKSFCLIEDDNIQQQVSQMNEEFFYRTCKAKEIIQTSNINPNQFNAFLLKFRQIKDTELLHKIYRKIDHHIFSHGTDPLAIAYSIFGIIDIPNEEKYRILTNFDEEKRVDAVKKVLLNLKHDVSFNVAGFLKVQKSSKSNYAIVSFFIFLFMIIYFINSGQNDEL